MQLQTPIHATDIRTFYECQRKFQYGIVERIKPKEYKNPEYFDFGHNWHDVLAAHYRGENTKLAISEITNDEIKSTIYVLYNLYKEHWKDEDQNFEIASIENVMHVDILGVRILFTIDILALEQVGRNTKQYVIIDHKAYKSFPDPKILVNDFQASFYLWAMNKLGIDVKRFILNVTRKTAPSYPTLLKNGKGLSRAKNELAQTEHALYLEAINLANLNVNDYTEELEFLKNRGSNTFKREKTRRSESFLSNFEEDLKYTIHDFMEANHRFVPIPGLHCISCPFDFLCRVQSEGGNVSLTKHSMYVKKDDNER